MSPGSHSLSSLAVGPGHQVGGHVMLGAVPREHGNGLIFSSPDEEWAHACGLLAEGDEPQKPKAEFRVMAQCSLDFHVLSTLWMLEVGHLFDAQLTAIAPTATGCAARRTARASTLSRSAPFSPTSSPFVIGATKAFRPCARRWTLTRRSWRSRRMSARSITS
jgi:hypothetical protein